eukprot:TRINITY_DN2256_c0_g2_i1.p1 TRINITY_DN2256_c0_g2~~TRINITY_DN2256_c0_g2_i1.p1  ORF type:complete len:769 (-),score=225.91 TRINITY_DN2256_c0_g2_i1:172-2361(-)
MENDDEDQAFTLEVEVIDSSGDDDDEQGDADGDHCDHADVEDLQHQQHIHHEEEKGEEGNEEDVCGEIDQEASRTSGEEEDGFERGGEKPKDHGPNEKEIGSCDDSSVEIIESSYESAEEREMEEMEEMEDMEEKEETEDLGQSVKTIEASDERRDEALDEAEELPLGAGIEDSPPSSVSQTREEPNEPVPESVKIDEDGREKMTETMEASDVLHQTQPPSTRIEPVRRVMVHIDTIFNHCIDKFKKDDKLFALLSAPFPRSLQKNDLPVAVKPFLSFEEYRTFKDKWKSIQIRIFVEESIFTWFSEITSTLTVERWRNLPLKIHRSWSDFCLDGDDHLRALIDNFDTYDMMLAESFAPIFRSQSKRKSDNLFKRHLIAFLISRESNISQSDANLLSHIPHYQSDFWDALHAPSDMLEAVVLMKRLIPFSSEPERAFISEILISHANKPLQLNDFVYEVACLACGILSRSPMDIDATMTFDLACPPASPLLELLGKELGMVTKDPYTLMKTLRQLVKLRRVHLPHTPIAPSFEAKILSPIINECLADCLHPVKFHTRADILTWSSGLVWPSETSALNWAMRTLLMRRHRSLLTIEEAKELLSHALIRIYKRRERVKDSVALLGENGAGGRVSGEQDSIEKISIKRWLEEDTITHPIGSPDIEHLVEWIFEKQISIADFIAQENKKILEEQTTMGILSKKRDRMWDLSPKDLVAFACEQRRKKLKGMTGE